MIHTYPKRLWYVNEYLIPSMLEQGIKREQITVYNDEAGDGNLLACMKAFASCPYNLEGTWHLQDDVIISKDFKERTEWYDQGLVCGFSSAMYDGIDINKQGAVPRVRMWFSFPCIRIPNRWAIECADWVTKYVIGNPVYKQFWENGVNDDWAFRAYLKEFQKDCVALNIIPNLVDHVDYLLGGGSGKKERKEPVRAQFWKDYDLIQKLEQKLNRKTRQSKSTQKEKINVTVEHDSL